MAPQRRNKRLNVPGSRTPATYDLKNQAHFNEFKKEGFIPDKYNNYAELQDDFLSLVYEGMSDADAAEALGVDYRNVIGKGYLAAELSSQGIPRGISARALREDIKPDERDYLIERFGKDWFDAYQRYRKLEWGDAKTLKKDKELIEQFSGRPVEEFTSAKQEADVLRDRLAAAFGKGGRAGQVHRGHGVSAMEGASVGKANLMPESGPLNVGHGSNPRYDYNVMRNLNMSANDLQNFYDDMLQREGLTINPRRYAGNYVAADEALRELKQGTSMGNPQVTVPVEPTQVDPRSIEWRDRRFFEIEQQLAGDYVRSGMSPNEAAAKARQRVEEYALGQSTLFNTTQSRGGPVTVVQPGKPMPRQIGTVVGEQLVDPFGRPKVDRSGEPKLETRPVYAPPSGAILAPSPAVTRSQSLGKTAAAIANREPLPAPKPAPPTQIRTEAELDRIFANTVKPPKIAPISGNFVPRGPVNITPTAKERALAAERANAGKTKAMSRSSGPPPATPSRISQPVTQPASTPQPKVGQPAVLNGKPVIWSGGKWMPVPAPKVKLKDTPNITPNPKPAPRVIPTKPRAAAKPPVRVIPSRTKPKPQESPRNQGSASMQIRRMQNIQPDVIQLPMFTGFPSIEL
jgi:hypothetical protein